jgi:cobalt-zinc-cadmium efflux system outer membrane protein
MMHKLKHTSVCAALVAGALGIGGCATVNPRPDYDRTAAHVEAATGRGLALRPDSDELEVQGRVQELLREGLTAGEAAEVCLLNNRGLRAAFYEVGAARADLVQAGLLSNPTLSLGLRFPDAGGLANFETALVQNLADLWQIPARKRAAQGLLDRTILQIARDFRDGVFDTKTAYYRARHADRRRELAAESVQIAQQVLDLALARQQAGAGGEVDVNLARAEVQDAELALRAAALESFEARSALAGLLSLRLPPETLVLTDPLPEPPDWSVPEDALLALASDHRLDLQAAQTATQAAAARVLQEQLKLFPTLELGVSLARDERRPAEGRNILADSVRASVDAGGPQVDIASKEPSAGQDTLLGPTLGMELPIFNQNQGGIARAQFEYAQSRSFFEALQVQADQEVRLASARARTAWSRAGFYRAQVLPLRETSLDLARAAYQAGRTPLLNVLEVQRALLRARAGYADSLEASAVALVELEQATGRPLDRILEATTAAAPVRPASAAATSRPSARGGDKD